MSHEPQPNDRRARFRQAPEEPEKAREKPAREKAPAKKRATKS